jgi:hypothetical protein
MNLDTIGYRFSYTHRLEPYKCAGKSSQLAPNAHHEQMITVQILVEPTCPCILWAFIFREKGYTEMDRARGRLFWKGTSQAYKYHMINFENISNPKEVKGLGTISSSHMNIFLMVKWTWKLLNKHNSLWHQVTKEYLSDGSPLKLT